MRLRLVHDELELGPDVGTELTFESPTSSSHQGGELTDGQHDLERRPLAAPELHALGPLGIIY
jgi:hypothetical protein